MTKEQEKLIREYTEYLYIRGACKCTVRKYKCYALRLLEYLEEMKLDFTGVRVKEAQEYQGWLLEKKQGYAGGTILNMIKAAVSFYKYLKTKKIVYANPFSEIKKVREDKKLPSNVVNEKEMQDILKEIRKFEQEKTIKQKVKRYKAHVIAELMYATGMRISEATGLTAGDIDFETGVITLCGAKKGRVRVCFLNEYAKTILENYVKRVKKHITYLWHTRPTLFGCSARQVTAIINTELKKACKKLKIKEITSHGFRHSFGYHLLKAGCSIRYIQALLGHKRLKSTEVYTKVDKKDLKRVVEKYHPRKWKEWEN